MKNQYLQDGKIYDAYCVKNALTKGIRKFRIRILSDSLYAVEALDDSNNLSQIYLRHEYALDAKLATELVQRKLDAGILAAERRLSRLVRYKIEIPE